jgi:hypothetical protein
MSKKYLDISSPVESFQKDADQPESPLSWIDRGWYVALEFELTSSAKFDQAVEMAKGHPHFAELVDERGVSLYRTIYFKKDFPKFEILYGLVGNWKSTRLYLKGDEITKTDFEIWYACYKTYWGHRKILNDGDTCGLTRTSVFPDFLGCYERHIVLKWRDPVFSSYQFSSKTWYHFGKRVRDTFVVDKEAMVSYLARTNEEYRVCPCYGHAGIDRFVSKLPKEINPVIYKEWLFKEDYLKTQARAMFNYEIAMSTLPDICPANEKAYLTFMNKLFQEEED